MQSFYLDLPKAKETVFKIAKSEQCLRDGNAPIL